jgi:hypothetical protein
LRSDDVLDEDAGMSSNDAVREAMVAVLAASAVPRDALLERVVASGVGPASSVEHRLDALLQSDTTFEEHAPGLDH